MNRSFLWVLFVGIALSSCNSTVEKEEPTSEQTSHKEESAVIAESEIKNTIGSLMAEQEKAWNSGDLEKFMEPYWHDDSLMFIGSSGVTYGWENTLENYRKGYPDTTAMGKLRFENLEIEPLSDSSVFVLGKWHLKRTTEDLGGYYTLLWKLQNGKWVIVADHSS